MKITRVFDLLENYREKYYNKSDVLAGKEDGKWIYYNTSDYIEMSNLFSYGLLEIGFKKGDKIVTITNNRPEWNFIDMGMLQVGVVNVPVYPTISKDDYYYILDHAAPKAIIVSDKNLYERIKSVASMAGIENIYTINRVENAKNWLQIVDTGKQNIEKHKEELNKIKNEIKSDDIFTLIYTSGTTGFPKGVLLSHNNIITNFVATAEVHSLGAESRALSFLPLNHIYERMLNYHYQYKGISIYYAENLGTIVENLKEVKPHIFMAVPRIFELLYDKIVSIGRDLPWIQQKIFFWTIKLGQKFELSSHKSVFYNFKLLLADKLVFYKWREALGGNVKLSVSGGATLQLRLAKIFWAAGIPIIEGYGLTETSPVIAVDNPLKKEIMLGTVGPVLRDVSLKIAHDGEILCKGPNVMQGYYKQPELTKEVIDNEGWFHTGDIGSLIDNKYLKITDRKKEIFKLSSGKYIAPQVIENKFKESVFIEQAMVLGENQKFASALVQPNFPYLHKWCSFHKIYFHNNDDLICKQRVIECYQKAINEINKLLGQTEQIKRFRLVADEWSTQSGELSPTLKLRRRFIYEKYKDIIEQIYVQNQAND
jgi:long-chain acyl-CoA synthetase